MPLISSTGINNFFTALFRKGTSTSPKTQDSSFTSVAKSTQPTHIRQNVVRQGTRQNNKSLFFRTPSFLKKMGKSTEPPNTYISGINVEEDIEQDVSQTLKLLQQNKAKLTLQVVWETSTSPNNGTEYQDAFYKNFGKQINSLKTSQLNKLYKDLNSKEMLRLRGGLQLAATQGFPQKVHAQARVDGPLTEFVKGIEAELAQEGDGNRGVSLAENKTFSPKSIHSTQLGIFKETSDHLEQLNRIVSDLINKNGGGLTDYSVSAKPLANWKGNKKVAKLLQDFSTQNVSSIHTDSGKVNARLRGEMKELLETLCYNGEHEFNTGGASIGLENPSDKNSRRLDVSNIYVVDFHRTPKTFFFKDGKQVTHHDTKLRGDVSEDRVPISDQLVEFCNQNANQAQRVNTLMSQETFEPIHSLLYKGVLGKHPKADEFGLGGQFTNSAVKKFANVKQMANGDIQVHLHELYQPLFYSHYEIVDQGVDHEAKKFYIDDKKSFIVADVIVNIPSAKSAKPQLQDYTYAIKIREGKQNDEIDQLHVPALMDSLVKPRPRDPTDLNKTISPHFSLAAAQQSVRERTNEQTDTVEPITINNQTDV